MITFREGWKIAKEHQMRYEAPYWEDEFTHTFHERRMVKSRWVAHTFDLVESVEQAIEMKRKAQAEV